MASFFKKITSEKIKTNKMLKYFFLATFKKMTVYFLIKKRNSVNAKLYKNEKKKNVVCDYENSSLHKVHHYLLRP